MRARAKRKKIWGQRMKMIWNREKKRAKKRKVGSKKMRQWWRMRLWHARRVELKSTNENFDSKLKMAKFHFGFFFSTHLAWMFEFKRRWNDDRASKRKQAEQSRQSVVEAEAAVATTNRFKWKHVNTRKHAHYTYSRSLGRSVSSIRAHTYA